MTDLNIEYIHPAYADFLPEWNMITDCIDGERKIKKARTKYLPHPSDLPSEDSGGVRYDAYLKRAPFINATGRTLQGLLGIAFNKTPKIKMSENLIFLDKNVDNQGQSSNQFSREAVSQVLQRGRAGILTDFTGTGTQTEAQKGRPALILFNAKQIKNWRVTNNKTSLIVLEYKEPEDDSNGFELVLRRRFIELRLINDIAYARRWIEDSNSLNSTELITLTDYAGTPLNELPWSWLGSENNDHTPDSPPLADIAYANIKHYQREADLAEACHTVGQPTVAITGLTTQWVNEFMPNGITVGSRKGLLLPVGADLKFAQPDERGILIQCAERIETQLAKLGAKLVERNTSARTATQASDEAQTDNSVLSLCVGNVEQAINRALSFAVKFVGSGEASIELNKQYEISTLDSQAIQTLMAAVQSGSLRLTDFIRYQQRIGLVSQDEAPEDIEQQLKDSGIESSR